MVKISVPFLNQIRNATMPDGKKWVNVQATQNGLHRINTPKFIEKHKFLPDVQWSRYSLVAQAPWWQVRAAQRHHDTTLHHDIGSWIYLHRDSQSHLDMLAIESSVSTIFLRIDYGHTRLTSISYKDSHDHQQDKILNNTRSMPRMSCHHKRLSSAKPQTFIQISVGRHLPASNSSDRKSVV